MPDGPAYKAAHFTRTGRIVRGTEELFKEASWFAVMTGQGLLPTDYNPLLDSISDEENRVHLQSIKQQISAAVASMEGHEDHIQRQLGSPP